MEKRYILALVLMAVVMFSWSIMFGKRLSKQKQPQTTEQPVEQSRQTSQLPSDESTEPQSRSARVEESAPDRQVVSQSQKVHVQTENYDITFDVERAIARRWVLRKYPNRSGVGEPSMNLIPDTALNCLSVHFLDSQLQLDAMRTTWEVDKTDLFLTAQNPQDTLTFSTRIGDDLKIFKTFTFYHGNYYVDLALTFKNGSNESFTAFDTMSDGHSGYKLRWGPGITADLLPNERKSGKRGRHNPKSEGAKALSEGSGKPVKVFDESQQTATTLWAGLNNKYFAALMIPQPSLQAQYQLETLSDNGKTPAIDITAPSEAASLIVPGFLLDAHQSRTDQFRVYVGPKKAKILKTVEAPGAPETPLQLTDIIDFGFFWPIAWAMLWLLNGFERVIPNYGVAIILLTLLTKLVSYPLTRKSYKSMKEMQKLQPLLTELREKYRDNPQKLNRATMQLYKEHGINPLGGCIPWIPQIPIFWALFALLGSAVELRGAHFFLWIDDLAAPDVLFTLPFSIPLLGNAVRFLPLVNGLTTWLQQRMTGGMTPATDNTQAKLMQFMPLLFVFLFYNWASGFVLYWLCNNVFTIGQQYFTKLQDPGEEKAVTPSPTRKQPQSKTAKKQPQSKRRRPSNVKT